VVSRQVRRLRHIDRGDAVELDHGHLVVAVLDVVQRARVRETHRAASSACEAAFLASPQDLGTVRYRHRVLRRLVTCWLSLRPAVGLGCAGA
jgi:hypothetical protein